MTGFPLNINHDADPRGERSPTAGEPRPFGPDNSPFEAIGGVEQVRRLVDLFYDHMDADPAYQTIRELHPSDLSQSREKLFEFLTGWMGGPQLYIEKYGHPRLRARHMHVAIGDAERDQWMACMTRAIDERGITDPLRTFLISRLGHTATFMRNREG